MQAFLFPLLVMLQAPADTLVIPLKEVVVTGSRIPEEVLRTPAAISVVDRRSFANTRGISLKDALGRVPGVFVQSRGGAQDVRVTIRGFGARGNGERSNAGNMRGIRVMSDGVPITEPDGRSSLDLVDLGAADRIEISRSNSSTLYGNASGGVVHLRTDLSFDRPGFEYLQRGGSFGYHREQGKLEFTAGAGRGMLSLLNSNFDGWRAHSSSSATLGQLRFATPVSDATRIGLMLDGVSDLNRFPGALTRAELDSLPEQADPRFVARDERRANRVGRVAMSVDQTRGRQDVNALVFVEPKVLQRSERNRFRDFTRYHVGGSGTWTMTTPWSDAWQGTTLVGVDEAFQDGAILFYDLDNGARGTTLIANKREAANSAGAFLQQEVRWSERWAVRLAARFDHLRYISEDHQDPALDAAKTFRRWTPKGSLAWMSAHNTIYAALGGGVEAPAFNEIDPPPPFDTLTSLNPFLEAMRSTTYEVGAKGALARETLLGSLRYDAALYWIDVRNEIVPFAGGAFFQTAGRSRRRGAELGLGWTPGRGIDLESAVTVSDNEYVDYRNDLGDFSGNETPGLPSVTASGALRYRHSSGASASATVEHVGRYFDDDTNSDEGRTAAYTLLGATLGLERSVGVGTVSAFVAGDNLTDEDYVASVFINGLFDAGQPPGRRGRFFEPGLPRNWSAGLSLSWR
jgi:iron complex outermembrane recepter protein